MFFCVVGQLAIRVPIRRNIFVIAITRRPVANIFVYLFEGLMLRWSNVTRHARVFVWLTQY